MIIANNIGIKIYIESGDVFELFWEYRESKVNLNFPFDNIWLFALFFEIFELFLLFQCVWRFSEWHFKAVLMKIKEDGLENARLLLPYFLKYPKVVFSLYLSPS